MRRACVIGWPISHSRSPLIHGYWLTRYGIDGCYTREPVEPSRAAEFLRTLEIRGLVGANVTVPHKEAAYTCADVVEDSARAAQAANTVWLDGGQLHAANTDTDGFMTHLALTAPAWRRDLPVAVLGAGGAARAIIHGLLEAGVPEVRLFNRSTDRAERIAARFGPRVRVEPWGKRTVRSRETGLIINTTTLGLNGEGTPGIDFAGFDGQTIVADIVYVPLETPFLASARLAGLRTVDGLGMLLHQAVPGFERWFGVRPEVTLELRTLILRDIEGR